MSAAAHLIRRATSNGFVLSRNGDRLRVDSPHDLPDDFRAALVEHKAEVLALLSDVKPDLPPNTWASLSAQRWGPSLDHDYPPIVIDRPSRDRMRDAVATLGDGPGDAWEGPNS